MVVGAQPRRCRSTRPPARPPRRGTSPPSPHRTRRPRRSRARSALPSFRSGGDERLPRLLSPGYSDAHRRVTPFLSWLARGGVDLDGCRWSRLKAHIDRIVRLILPLADGRPQRCEHARGPSPATGTDPVGKPTRTGLTIVGVTSRMGTAGQSRWRTRGCTMGSLVAPVARSVPVQGRSFRVQRRSVRSQCDPRQAGGATAQPPAGLLTPTGRRMGRQRAADARAGPRTGRTGLGGQW